MKFFKKALDVCCVLLTGSLLIMVCGLLFLGLATERASIPENIESIVKTVIQLSVLFFSISAIALWLYAIRELWLTRSKRSLVINFFYFFLVIGFSWLAGLIIYRKTSYKLNEGNTH